jgi:hypothetical protein
MYPEKSLGLQFYLPPVLVNSGDLMPIAIES